MDNIATNKTDRNPSKEREIPETPYLARIIRRYKLDKILFTVIAFALILIYEYPVILTIMNAFKTNGEVMLGPLSLPIPPTVGGIYSGVDILEFPTINA